MCHDGVLLVQTGIVCFHIGNELLVQLHLARLFDQTQNTLLPV